MHENHKPILLRTLARLEGEDAVAEAQQTPQAYLDSLWYDYADVREDQDREYYYCGVHFRVSGPVVELTFPHTTWTFTTDVYRYVRYMAPENGSVTAYYVGENFDFLANSESIGRTDLLRVDPKRSWPYNSLCGLIEHEVAHLWNTK